MSLLPEIANPYVAALAGGFLYGLVFCTSTCLPYVASYIAGINAGFRRGMTVTMIFNAGRITAYAIIGAAIGALRLLVDESMRTVFQTYSAYLFSITTLIIGVSILLRKNPAGCNCVAEELQKPSKHRLLERFDLRAYSLGLTRGMILCAPLLTILAYAVSFASPIDSLLLAVLFGVGTALSPIILLGGATGWLLNKAPLFRIWISRAGGIALIVLGAVMLVDTIII
jgi:sulfite exporter TauE/SafE